MASQWNDKRPLAPHLQIWRWHPAMLSSILHRACTIISYAALIKFGLGLLYLKQTQSLPFEGLLYSPLGVIGLFIGLFSLIFMGFAQLRHLVWDQGKFFEPETNNKMSWAMIVLALVLAAGLTGSAVIMGGA